MGGGYTEDQQQTKRAEGGELNKCSATNVMGEESEEEQSTPIINQPPTIDTAEIIRLLIDVMRGSLDGQKTTTSERIRAGTLLMKYIIEGEADTRREEEDELSRAIEDYYREEE